MKDVVRLNGRRMAVSKSAGVMSLLCSPRVREVVRTGTRDG